MDSDAERERNGSKESSDRTVVVCVIKLTICHLKEGSESMMAFAWKERGKGKGRFFFYLQRFIRIYPLYFIYFLSYYCYYYKCFVEAVDKTNWRD